MVPTLTRGATNYRIGKHIEFRVVSSGSAWLEADPQAARGMNFVKRN